MWGLTPKNGGRGRFQYVFYMCLREILMNYDEFWMLIPTYPNPNMVYIIVSLFYHGLVDGDPYDP